METPFQFEGKALSTIELEEGDLLLDGLAVVFAGLDREGENFAEALLGVPVRLS